MQSAKHSEQRLRFNCSHFREIIYVEALLPRPHMPGQICPCALQVRTFHFTAQLCTFGEQCLPLPKNAFLVVRETYLIELAHNMSPITFAVVGYMHAQKEGVELDCPSQVFRKVTNHIITSRRNLLPPNGGLKPRPSACTWTWIKEECITCT